MEEERKYESRIENWPEDGSKDSRFWHLRHQAPQVASAPGKGGVGIVRWLHKEIFAQSTYLRAGHAVGFESRKQSIFTSFERSCSRDNSVYEPSKTNSCGTTMIDGCFKD